MKVDLVVTDLEMPRTNGYELIAHLKQNPQTRNLPGHGRDLTRRRET